jgi:KDO2-lipid IV(A) lauroyltransferase
MFAVAIYKLGARLAQSLSLPTAHKLSHVVGRLMCFLQRRNRRILLRNLEVAFGHERSTADLKRLRREIFKGFTVSVTDFLRMPLVNRDNLSDYITTEGLESIRRLGVLADDGTPTILTTAHLGNWELTAAATGLLAGPVSVLVLDHSNPHVTRFFDERRADKGIDVVPVSAFHRSFRALKKGHLVAIVGDRPVTGQGIVATYFGRPALMPDGYAVLARRLGARIVPLFLVKRPDGKHDVVVEKPIEPRVTDDVEADVRDTVQRCLAVFEPYVRRYPEQWYVFHPIWDTDDAESRDRHDVRRMRSLGEAPGTG